jgi:hypothetical protein
MNRRTQVLIGLSLVLLGAGAWAVGLVDADSNVRRVEDVVAEPARYHGGRTVLLGVPQPPEVPLATSQGVVLAPNDGWSDRIVHTVRWSDADGQAWYSTRTVVVTLDAEGALWSYRNETRRLPADPEPAFEPATMAWRTTGSRVFAIEAFRDATADTPRVWGLYSGVLKDPMQPKPSQFTGHLLATLPDGRPVPDGAYLYHVEEFKAGCSSKFLPPEEKERLRESGDL